DNLRPGTYSIVETQPRAFLDGKDTIGTQGGSTSNDRFFDIVLGAGVNGVNNNFGELPRPGCRLDRFGSHTHAWALVVKVRGSGVNALPTSLARPAAPSKAPLVNYWMPSLAFKARLAQAGALRRSTATR